MIGAWFYIFCGLWALGVLIVFIQAIRLSYRIEARSPDLVNKTGLPMRAKLLHTASNWKVARDPETQALRKRMNTLLLICLAAMAVMAIGINWAQATGR